MIKDVIMNFHKICLYFLLHWTNFRRFLVYFWVIFSNTISASVRNIPGKVFWEDGGFYLKGILGEFSAYFLRIIPKTSMNKTWNLFEIIPQKTKKKQWENDKNFWKIQQNFGKTEDSIVFQEIF